MSAPDRRKSLRRRLLLQAEVGSLGRSLGIALLVGVAGGLAAVAFELLIHVMREDAIASRFGLTREGLGGASLPLWVVLVPAAGGLLAGWVIQRWAPEAEGHGTEQMVQNFHRRGGVVRPRVIAVKAVASALTIGSGGSAGQEGPVAQMGGGVGSGLAQAFKMNERDRRVLLLSGASAGIGAMFSAPLGAALFAPEVLYRKPEYEGDAIIPCILASIVAYTTKTSLQGDHRPIPIPGETLADLAFGGAVELVPYLALAVLCTLVGWIYIQVYASVHGAFERMSRIPRWVRPGVGGLLLGAIAFVIAPLAGEFGVLFGGYELIEGSIAGEIAIGTLLLLVGAKMVATSVSIGSGGSGGLFAPSLAIGALLGSTVGKAAESLGVFGDVNPAAFALVGMGGFFAGVAHTPIAATIIVCEMTGSYSLLAPLVLVSVVHMILARRWTIYESQVEGLVDSPAHAGEFVVDVLERMQVMEVYDRERAIASVSQNATLRKALDIVSTAVGSYFPVVDGDGKLVGIFSLSDIRRIMLETGVQDLVIAKDFMVERVATVQPEDDLNTALTRLNEYSIHEIPVVAESDPREVIGMLSRNQIGAAYHKRLQQLRAAKG